MLVFSPGDYFTNDRVTPVKLTWPRNVNVSVVELTDGTKNNFVHLKRLKMLKVKRGMCLPCFKTNIHDLCAWWKNEILHWHYMMVWCYSYINRHNSYWISWWTRLPETPPITLLGLIPPTPPLRVTLCAWLLKPLLGISPHGRAARIASDNASHPHRPPFFFCSANCQSFIYKSDVLVA